MSIESSWDLHSTCSARSLCVFSPNISTSSNPNNNAGGSSSSSVSNNPFDGVNVSLGGSSTKNSNKNNINDVTNDNNVQAIVFGTERGSLHYRTFSSPMALTNSNNNANSMNHARGGIIRGSTAGMGSTSTSNSSGMNLLSPLGLVGGNSNTGTANTELPRSLYPVDLPSGSLPGLVASVIGAFPPPTASTTSNTPFIFLLLIDDNRGTSASSPGAYVPRLVSLNPNGTFTFLTKSSVLSSLPRISCATYHPRCGFVYSKGSTISTIAPNLWEKEVYDNSNNNASSSQSIFSSVSNATLNSATATTIASLPAQKRYVTFGKQPILPGNARTGQDAITVTGAGKVAVVAINNNSFHAVTGIEMTTEDILSSYSNNNSTSNNTNTNSSTGTTSGNNNNSNNLPMECVKLISFGQSSQVHPAIVLDIHDTTTDNDWYVLFLASGRECAIIDLYYGPPQDPHISCSKPRHGGQTTTPVTFASPILAAASSFPFIAILTSDGLISIRSPSCMAIALRTVEVGTRPNDYFILRSLLPRFYLQQQHQQQIGNTNHNFYSSSSSTTTPFSSRGGGGVHPQPNESSSFPFYNNYYQKIYLISISYSGIGKVLTCLPDTIQDLSDRLMRLSIDAFGSNGFPRAELADAVNASFTATSYVGPEPTLQSRLLLKQYLEAILGLADFDSGSASGWPTEIMVNNNYFNNSNNNSPMMMNHHQQQQHHYGAFFPTTTSVGAFDTSSGGSRGAGGFLQDDNANKNTNNNIVITSASPAALLTCTALLCLVCSQISPPQTQLASRAAKSCVESMGVVLLGSSSNMNDLGSERGETSIITTSTSSFHSGSGGIDNHYNISKSAVIVCELVADKLLREVSTSFSLLQSPSTATNSSRMEFVESAVWLLRSCGKHERAIEVLYERLQQQQQQGVVIVGEHQHQQQSSTGSGKHGSGGGSGIGTEVSTSTSGASTGLWSKIKYESYTATHLSELWGSGKDEGCMLVLKSTSTRRLLESNPRLGLSAFTALHPQNINQWKNMLARDDPLAHPTYPIKVIQLLKSVHPLVPYDQQQQQNNYNNDKKENNQSQIDELPLETGRALAISFLESAMGIYTGRPTEQDEFDSLPPDEHYTERIANLHDELGYLLLEGIISERGDSSMDDDEDNMNTNTANNIKIEFDSKNNYYYNNSYSNDEEKDTNLGRLYRNKLRCFLQWPLCKIHSERFMKSLPASFLQEKAFLLGRLDRHEDALRILYKDLKSMDLSLQYCDLRHERRKVYEEKYRARAQNATQGTIFEDSFYDELANSNNISGTNVNPKDSKCAYLPLVRVALEDENEQYGVTSAIQILALRRSAIDRAAALRLLPQDVPVAAVARPFLIPALVDSESQVRRLTVVSSLLRARYVTLKQQLTNAQLKAQAHIHVVPQLRSLNLGDMIHSTKPIRARPSSSASSTFPDVVIVKYFFMRHLVIQAKITHSLEGRVLGDVTFVVAESSEETIQPLLQIPLKLLPYKVQGSSWCVLSVSGHAASQSSSQSQSQQQLPSLRMSGMVEPTAILTCELRYTVSDANDTNIGGTTASTPSAAGRIYVEELQDIEVHSSHFS